MIQQSINNYIFRTRKSKVSLLLRFRRAAERNAYPMAMYVPWTSPKWLTNRGMIYYFIALLVVSVMYAAYSMPWYFMLSGVISVLMFFAYGRHLSERFSLRHVNSAQLFERKIFGVAFILRLFWMSVIYIVFMEAYGNPFGFENIDTMNYHQMGVYVAGMLDRGDYHFYQALSKKFHFDISDIGYGTYVGFVYYLTGKSIVALRVMKCLWSALTVVLIYRLALRHFSPQVARIAAIFCTLWPNFWYYSAVHLKETEMTFLVVLFVEQADQMLKSRQFTIWKLLPLMLIVGALFTIRTVAALVCILALLISVVMSSSRVVSWGKRIIVGLLAVAFIGVSMGERIAQNAQQMMEQVEGGYQQHGLENASKSKRGNSLVKYASASVFAPMIFTIPFPAMVDVAGHYSSELLNGGMYIKNILSFFVILSMFIMLFSGSWREHMLPIAFTLGYLLVLIMSMYAASARFHVPTMPLELMFAAYGLSIVMSNRKLQKWFKYWCVIMLVAAVAWNWFKLAGRGMA